MNDANGNNTFAAPFSDTINSKVLAASVAESDTVPAGANFVIFSYTDDIYVNIAGTAAVSTDITNGTASEINPTIRSVEAGDTISIISESAAKVSLAYYS